MKTTSFTSFPQCYRASLHRVGRRVQPARRLRQMLVLLLSVALVLTSLPVIERLTPPAQAQIVVRNCNPTADQIIQQCALGGGPEGALESTVINELLKAHKLPASDKSLLLGWERDLIRAGMYAKLIYDIQNGSNQDPIPELAKLVKARRLLAATKALDEFNRWAGSCPYTPPANIFTYTETQCTGLAVLFGRNPPSFEEFQAYGAYLANLEIQNNPALLVSANNMALGIGAISGFAAAGVAAGILVGLSVTGALTSALFPFAGVVGSVATIVGVTAVAAPVAAILFAVIVGVIRGIQVVNAEQIPVKLQEAKTTAQNETINLAQVITTDNGRREVLNEFLQATFPDFPATTGVPAPSTSDPKFEIRPGSGVGLPVSTSSLQYKDWDGNAHTLRLNSGWFVDSKGSGPERLALSVKFLNAQGRKRQVSRVGSEFMITDVSEDKAEPFKSLEFAYLDASGNAYYARVPNTAPTVSAFNVTRRQSPPEPTTDHLGNPTNNNVAQIATIADDLDKVELLQLTMPATINGVTISEITVQPDGKVMARVQPSCSATSATFTLKVTDTAGATTTRFIDVTVTPNAAPVLSYATQNVVVGGALTVMPTAGPSDDGGGVGLNISGPQALTLGTPTITPLNSSAPFTGMVSHSTHVGNIYFLAPSGPLDIKNAGPTGSYRVNVPLTDICGLTTVGTFILNVTCAPIIWGHSISNPTCNGASNGRIEINASGGTGALKYSKDNGQTFQDSNIFSDLTGGTYNLVVKDSSGCATQSRTVTLVDPVAVTFTATPVNPTCNGTSNGRITVSASGGTNSFTYSLNGGSFVSSNVFTGLAAGSYKIIVKDSNGCASAEQSVTLTQPAALSLTPDGLPTAQAGIVFSQSLGTSGGTGAKTVSLSGTLPSGVSFTPASNGGMLAGTPLQTGSFPLSLTITDQNTCTMTRNITLTVACPTITLAPATLPYAQPGKDYSASLGTTPAGGNYTFALTSGALPPGLTLQPDGQLTGRPRQPGTYDFRITATGFGGQCSGSHDYQLNVETCTAIRILPLSLSNGVSGAAYSQTLSATPPGAYSFAVTGGALPPGLTLQSGGQLSGAPTQSGVYNFTVEATGSNNCTGSRGYALTVAAGTSLLANDDGTGAGEVHGKAAVANDFDGDGKSDLVLWRGETSEWLIARSSDGQTEAVKWDAGYEPKLDAVVSRDYDGDGKADLAIFNRAFGKEDGHWFIKQSSDGAMVDKPWGLGTDVPVAADYDGDGKTDIAVWRGAEGAWYINRSSDGEAQIILLEAAFAPFRDVPVQADYDGDGKADVAVFRQASGHWYIKLSSDGSVLEKAWGMDTDAPVAADYDGDGKADIAVWRGAEGVWSILRSSDGREQVISCVASSLDDVPALGDYDGDGKTDAALWRVPESRWYVRQSSDDAIHTKGHGQRDDKPEMAKPQP